MSIEHYFNPGYPLKEEEGVLQCKKCNELPNATLGSSFIGGLRCSCLVHFHWAREPTEENEILRILIKEWNEFNSNTFEGEIIKDQKQLEKKE